MKKYLVAGLIVFVVVLMQAPKAFADVVVPTVSTGTITGDAVSGVTDTTANVTGQVIDDGGEPTHVTFEYGTETSYGSIADSGFTVTLNNQVNYTISGLICGTTYHYRAVGTNSAGSANGEDMIFSTSSCSSITILSPNGGESYVAGDTITVTWNSVGILSDNVYIGLSFPISWLPNGMGTTLTGPIPNTGSYQLALPDVSAFIAPGFLQNGNYYKIYIRDENSSAISDYSDSEFSIDSGLPVVHTDVATGIGETYAVLSGNVNGGIDIFSIGFQIGTSVLYDYSFTTEGNGSFPLGVYTIGTAGILRCNTTYHYRFYATNNLGTGYGIDKTFTTSSCIGGTPQVITSPAVSITGHSATLRGGFYNATEGVDYTSGFEFGTTTEYGNTMTFPTAHTSGSTFASLTGFNLYCDTTYHFRALASDGTDTWYGDDMIFDTSVCNVLETKPATEITETTAHIRAHLLSNDGVLNQYEFEYGITTAYGMVTPAGYLTSHLTDPATFEEVITGLTCGTTYHYKPNITFSEIPKPNVGTVFGMDMTFTTLPCSSGDGRNSPHSSGGPCLMPDADKNPNCNQSQKNADSVEKIIETIPVLQKNNQQVLETSITVTPKTEIPSQGLSLTVENNDTNDVQDKNDDELKNEATIINSGFEITGSLWLWLILIIVIIAGIYTGYKKGKSKE